MCHSFARGLAGITATPTARSATVMAEDEEAQGRIARMTPRAPVSCGHPLAREPEGLWGGDKDRACPGGRRRRGENTCAPCGLRRSPPRLGDAWHRSAGPIADGAVQSAEVRDARGGCWLCGVGANNGLHVARQVRGRAALRSFPGAFPRCALRCFAGIEPSAHERALP